MITTVPEAPSRGVRRASPPLVELRGVGKRFGGVRALHGVDLEIRTGEVHGLVGENGAGKSTLGKIVAGVHRPDVGHLCVAGEPVDYRSPHDALGDGLTIIAQELALVPQLRVAENVFLGAEPHRNGIVDRARLLARFHELTELGFQLDPNAPVGSLSTAEQQKVEILRAIARRARLIVMDEPTASLTPYEVGRLKATVARLREQGTTVVFVSHALEDVLELCDRITVLRNGEVVRTVLAAEASARTLVRDMVGTDLDVSFPAKAAPPVDADPILEVRGLDVPGAVSDVSLTIRRGEIVGLAGLMGSGRSELAQGLFGARPATADRFRLDGRDLVVRSPRDAIAAGIALLPESRKDSGLVMGRSITDNMSLPHLTEVSAGGVVRRRRERRRAHRTADRVRIKAPDFEVPVTSLSGGNQQKVLLAKWLYRTPKLLIADEPTRGVDVGAKRSIYEILTGLAAHGLAILLISSELEEVLGLSHRVLVLREGRLAGEIHGTSLTGEGILEMAFGSSVDTQDGAP